MDVRTVFELWRSEHKCEDGWGLAWYLAYEFCVRFYAVHGILPGIIEHDGTGYCGIQLEQVQCKINPEPMPPLGRITASGNIENWTTDQTLNTTDMCDNGVETDSIVAASIRHIDFYSTQKKSHLHCLHRRRGRYYEIIFAVATILALRNNRKKVKIWNRPCDTEQIVLDIKPWTQFIEHTGAFVFESNHRRIVICTDGRMLGVNRVNYHNRYLNGASPYALALDLERLLSEPELPDVTIESLQM